MLPDLQVALILRIQQIPYLLVVYLNEGYFNRKGQCIGAQFVDSLEQTIMVVGLQLVTFSCEAK